MWPAVRRLCARRQKPYNWRHSWSSVQSCRRAYHPCSLTRVRTQLFRSFGIPSASSSAGPNLPLNVDLDRNPTDPCGGTRRRRLPQWVAARVPSVTFLEGPIRKQEHRNDDEKRSRRREQKSTFGTVCAAPTISPIVRGTRPPKIAEETTSSRGRLKGPDTPSTNSVHVKRQVNLELKCASRKRRRKRKEPVRPCPRPRPGSQESWCTFLFARWMICRNFPTPRERVVHLTSLGLPIEQLGSLSQIATRGRVTWAGKKRC